MSSSFARRWFLRPPFPEHITAGSMQTFARARLLYIGGAMVVNVLIWALMRGSASLDQQVLRSFLLINMSLLAVSALLSAKLIVRPGRRARLIHGVCFVIDVFTVIVWVQVTGTVSSYFVAAALGLIVAHRLGSDYGVALASIVAVVVFHTGAFALEELGGLRPASLFVADLTGTYALPEYRWAVMISILSLYLMAFVLSNFVVLKLREKDSALREARETILRMGDAPDLGRLSGTVLAGKVELTEVLGRGGMGEVYAGRRLDDARPVAVKVLHAHLQHRQALARFRREVDAARMLPTAFVAEVLEVGETNDGNHYIVMERLQGEDLGAFLRRREPLTVAECTRLCRAIATIIDAAHAAGIVHRDLKPSNIFLAGDLDGEHPVRLLDFGISRLRSDSADTLTATAEVLGSPGYMAPEQAIGQPGLVGPATDVFALGAVVYRGLTGKSAFPSRSAGAALYEALHHQPERPSSARTDLSPALDDVLAIALAKTPADRFQRASELAAALEGAAAGAISEELRGRAEAVRGRDARAGDTLTAP